MFVKEVEMADYYQTILHGNDLPTKITSFSVKLYNLFEQILVKMFIADFHSYEVDRSRIEQHKKLNENRKNLRLLTQDIFQAIIDSVILTVIFLRFLNPAFILLHEFGIVNAEPLPQKIRDYLSSGRDYKAIGRRPFYKMATLLTYFGPPDYRLLDS
ncbi:unnamed protein product [Rotaria sordida]|uniref:Ras-GAP domain-containing protein n=1 Tax=Rotaria sordida TaxID=392033 RepID=A0A819QW12_9BILA|nr:unnamed protein product [Rotaria sordida]